MVSKHTRVSRRMLFTWFMLSGLILLFAPRGLTGKMQLGFVKIFRWPLSIGGNLALTANTEQTLTDVVPRREHEKLLNHANNLQAKLNNQEKMFRKLSSLYEKYDMWEGVDFVEGKVITANVGGDRSELTIKYGMKAPIHKGQFVLRDNSIIGRISDASAGTARVTLFTNKNTPTPVKIGSLDKPMLMIGNGDNSARIPNVEIKYQIKVGDMVFAVDLNYKDKAGDDSLIRYTGRKFLDSPMVIGVVTQCKKNRKEPLIWDITVKPVCDLENLEDVYVIIMDSQT